MVVIAKDVIEKIAKTNPALAKEIAQKKGLVDNQKTIIK